jgi:hypothetical protein
VGVYTYYPPPEQHEKEIRELTQQEQGIRDHRSPERLTEEDLQEISTIVAERNKLRDAAKDALEPWGRSTSIILIIFATLTMMISLIRADQLPVISNGLLLGGLFSMLYGIGWVIATDSSVSRFWVLTFALVITLVLGYVRFVRLGKSAGAAEEFKEESRGDLDRRVQSLEDRLGKVAEALGNRDRG